MTIAIVGCGSFAQDFIPLFQVHPLVSDVLLCDTDQVKLSDTAARHGIERTCQSLEEVLASEVDAVAIFTQNWLHGPQAVQALRAGKHVYSAVPPAITVQEVESLVNAVEETGYVYMLGETSYYYPGTIFCRQQFAKGAFGRVVYCEGEYYHDWDHGLYDVMRTRGGEQWRRFAGSPPMHYPTHSVAPIVSVLGRRMTHVSCQGFEDSESEIYGPDANVWDNRFSNQSALFRMSDGSVCRINEFRRIGHPCVERVSIYGTEGCFQDSVAGAVWTDKHDVTRLDDLLKCASRTPGGTEVSPDSAEPAFRGVSPLHEIARLPKEFVGLPNGHFGSHQFLVDDFVKAVHSGQQPRNDVWQAARYVLPGLVAHESALRGGEMLEIPDFGHQ
jgi:predicted dehydrogenase